MKRTFSLLLILLFIPIFCACQPSQDKLAFVLDGTEDDPYASFLANGFCTAAEQMGYSCTIEKPANDSSQAQAYVIAHLIREGVKGIAITPNQVNGLEDIIAEAQNAGIPVITVSQDAVGSDLLIQPSSIDLVGAALMDAIWELCAGDGEFVVLSGETPFSGMDPWVTGMKAAAMDSKYAKLTWAETNYSYRLDGVEGMKSLILSLLDKYPDLEVVCCPGVETLVACCHAVEELGVKLRVTGLSQPARMQNLVGEERACPYFFLWNPNDIGACAAHALDALVKGASLQKEATLTTGLGEYKLYPGIHADFYIYAGPPFRFTADTIANTPIY